MFPRRCLLVLVMVILCQDLGFHMPTGTCRFGALGDNSTQTLVVTVSAEPGLGQELIKELVKASQNATLRATDSRGTPLRPLDDEHKGPAPLGPRWRPRLEASPSAEPPEPGRRCPRERPPPTADPPQIGAAVAAAEGDAVAAADKVACETKCSDQDGVEESVNMCDEGCEAGKTKREARALKEFKEVVDGGNEAAAEAAKDGEEMQKADEACRACKKKADPCSGVKKVEGADGAESSESSGGTCPAVEGIEGSRTCAANEAPAGAKICRAEANSEGDSCGGKDGKKGADPCRPADGRDEDKPPVDPAVDPITGDSVNVEVKVVEEPQCRISLEEETQVNAECRSCSARVLPGGGVKLTCFQCEHRPSDQTCYFARKMDPIFKVSARFFEMAELSAKKNNTSIQVLHK